MTKKTGINWKWKVLLALGGATVFCWAAVEGGITIIGQFTDAISQPAKTEAPANTSNVKTGAGNE